MVGKRRLPIMGRAIRALAIGVALVLAGALAGFVARLVWPQR